MGYHASDAEKRKWYLSLTAIHKQATLDFVQLQHIDYAAAFNGGHKAGVMADGITVGFQSSQLYLVSLIKPCAAAASGGEGMGGYSSAASRSA